MKHPTNKKWRLLQVYSIYRFLSVFAILALYYFDDATHAHSIYCIRLIFIYFLCALGFLYLALMQKISFDKQVLLSGCIDILIVTTIFSFVGNTKLDYGILLNITIATLSILAPGRLAIFFAALASSLLLFGNLLNFFNAEQKDLGIFYFSGIYGAGFFGTALTAWYLSSWVRVSEQVAEERSAKLIEMQRINEYIVDRLHSGIIYTDENQDIKLINSAARQFFNLKKANMPENIKQLSPSLSEKFNEFQLNAQKNGSLEKNVIEDPYLRINFFPTFLGDSPAVLIVLEDMTHIAQHAQHLKLASLGRFSASIAHEIRNPLGAIAHAAQLLGDDEPLNAGDERLKQLIMANCTRMNEVIKNVLQLTRRQKSQPQVIEVAAFLEQFKQNFCRNHVCDFEIKLAKNNTCKIVFDPSQLEQILVILCDNAMQHGQDEEGHVHLVITVKSSSNKTELCVSDFGPGIPREVRENIFDPFFTTLRHGTGMGLFLAKDLCEINQARLRLAKSAKGSSFVITLNMSDELFV